MRCATAKLVSKEAQFCSNGSSQQAFKWASSPQHDNQQAFKWAPAEASFDPPNVHLPRLLHLCRDARSLSQGMEAHTAIVEFGVDHLDLLLESALVHMYGHHGAIEDAHHLFSTMDHKDKFTWNNVIKAHTHHGHGYEALQCFEQMQLEGVLPDMFVYASMLSECTLAHPNKGEQLHSVITSSQIEIDVVVGTALVNMYGKSGRLVDAHRAFEAMVEHDTASWNAILSSHAQLEQMKETFDLFKKMQEQEVALNKVTFISILPAFDSEEALPTGKEIHITLTKYGFDLDLNVGNSLINMYGKCGSMEDAWGIFEAMPEKNTLTWTVMITSLVQNGHNTDTFCLYQQMWSEGAISDKVTYVSMLSAYENQTKLVQGTMMHAIIMHGLGHIDVELRNSILNMYSKCGSLEAARKVFDDTVERSRVSWNAMISAYLQHGQNQAAIELFLQMKTCHYVPDKVSFLNILSACAQESGINKRIFFNVAMELHSSMICYGLDTDITLGNTLVLMYGRHNALMDAQKVFNSLCNRTAVSWSIMIAEQGEHGRCAQLFAQMMEEGIMPDKGTIINLLSICDHPSFLSLGKSMHARIMYNHAAEMDTGNKLIDMYQKCGSISHAQEVFDDMPERDRVAWTEMIAGYADIGESYLALALFDQMQQEGLATDRVTYICILSACANHTALAKGKLLHSCLVVSNLELDIATGNAIINMYGKCGHMEEARRFFSRMPMRDVVSWSSMIANYAQHGHSRDALAMFHDMRQEKVLPDQITFVSVLTACSHVGHVCEGCYWFEFMKKELSIMPTLDHYNCMVDLLGRAGMLTKAENMIQDMPFEPNVVTWMTLLGACRYHVDIERGEHYANQVFKLDPLEPAPYVMLSNVYLAAGKEEEAAKIISQMKEKGLSQESCHRQVGIRSMPLEMGIFNTLTVETCDMSSKPS